MQNSNNSKKIAKNTVMLYSRMMFVMLTNLYASRLILDNLGIVDYGIYNIVGGIVVMLSFLNSSLSGATSRFLTYEQGNGNTLQLNKIFSTALTIHIIIAVIIMILSETVGMWFVECKLVIPENRIVATRTVYQLSVLSCLIQVIQIPYTATILSREKMNVYAYISVIDVILKLISAYILANINLDKLITYALLLLITSTITLMCYRTYCKEKFQECNFKFIYDASLTKQIVGFSIWDLYGNMSWMLSMQGTNIILNIFFGAPINAAMGIANQVKNSIYGFSSNVYTAVKPQIIKYYAQNNIKEMLSLVENSSKFSFVLLLIVSLPLYLENNFVISIWLNKIPDYTVLYCQLSLVYNLINAIFYPIIISIHATGKVKAVSFITGSIYLTTLPILYVLFILGASPIYSSTISIIVLIIASVCNLIIIKKQINEFSIFNYIKNVLLKCAFLLFTSSIVPLLIVIYLSEGWTRLGFSIIASVCSVTISSYYIMISKEQKYNILRKIKNFKHQNMNFRLMFIKT